MGIGNTAGMLIVLGGMLMPPPHWQHATGNAAGPGPEGGRRTAKLKEWRARIVLICQGKKGGVGLGVKSEQRASLTSSSHRAHIELTSSSH